MNNQTQEALKMAISFASVISETYATGGEAERVINACKEALEQPAQEPVMIEDCNAARQILEYKNKQPAQEPVAWMKSAIDNARDVCKYLDHDMIDEAKAHTKFFWNDLDKIKEFEDGTKLYTHPAQPLSDDEICKIYEDIRWDIRGTDIVIDFARAIEQALKEKNT